MKKRKMKSKCIVCGSKITGFVCMNCNPFGDIVCHKCFKDPNKMLKFLLEDK